VSLQAAAEYVQQHVGSLNLLLNVTGVLHSPEGLNPERALAKVEAANLLLSYHVNAVGPTMVTRAFAPLLQTTATATLNRCVRTTPQRRNVTKRGGGGFPQQVSALFLA
jgi:NAD(P)-dependent dehydrogenase (short-subunit alcohol dehydrogenase family)